MGYSFTLHTPFSLLFHPPARFFFTPPPLYVQARVIKNRLTHKSMGYGFVSFKDPWDMTKALREMQGKYIGNRPVKVSTKPTL
jgi:RNA recognition motif-containing protein